VKLEGLRHIAVEGPIGVGKSSLARRLAAHLGHEPLLERPEDNPFLARYYADGARHALQTQLVFLFQRLEQLRTLAQPGMFERGIVADFMFEKDALFAALTLDADEHRLYTQIHAHVAPPSLPRPDLVIWLQASPATLLERIRRRGLAMEQGLAAHDLQRLADAYGAHFEHARELPLLAVDTEAFHPAASDTDFARLLQRIAGFRGPRELFEPGAALLG
jgi:deoxyadenosine/deoxycytidine kinase